MNKFFRWLKTRTAKPTMPAENSARHISVNEVLTRKQNAPDYTIESGFGAAADDRPTFPQAENDQTRDFTYQCDDTIAQRQLHLLNDSAGDTAQASSSDPYNTCDHDISKSWRSVAHK